MNLSNSDLAVWLSDQAQETDACALAQRLGLTTVSGPLKFLGVPFVLVLDKYGLALQQTGKKAPGPVRIDFESGASAHRRIQGGGELIIKALGGSKQQPPSVVDATAGLGRDSFVMASWGASVTMLERSPIVHALLEDGLARAANTTDPDLLEILSRLTLQSGDAQAYLASLEGEDRPDVVYIDPMFPASKKSALVKKDMQAFHQVVGADTDSEFLLDSALEAAVHRVVVKRPKKAEPVGGREPAYRLEGKAIRFDVYSLKAFGKP